MTVGRGVPEIDVIEARVATDTMQGLASQSFQVAPYSTGHKWVDTSPATTIYNTTMTYENGYHGGALQESISANSYLEDQFYGGQAFAPYAYEYWSDPNNRDDGYITWFSNNQKTWTVTSATVGPMEAVNVSQRLIPEEPMVSGATYLIYAIGLTLRSTLFSILGWLLISNRQITSIWCFQLRCSLIMSECTNARAYKNGVGCNPPNRPTTDYINK